MASKSETASNKQDAAASDVKRDVAARESSLAERDGRCSQCGRWRCDGLCQYGGT